MKCRIALLLVMRILFLLEERPPQQGEDREKLTDLKVICAYLCREMGSLIYKDACLHDATQLCELALDTKQLDKVIDHLLAKVQVTFCSCDLCLQEKQVQWPVLTSDFPSNTEGRDLTFRFSFDDMGATNVPSMAKMKDASGWWVERAEQKIHDALSIHREECPHCDEESLCEEGKRILRCLWGEQ